MTDAADALAAIVGTAHVLTSHADRAAYGTDWTQRYVPDPLLVVRPGHTGEVSQILAWCNRFRVPVVPSGGRTGLAGGAVAARGEVVVSLDRMNAIETIDPVGLFARVQAGVTTQALKEAAETFGLSYAPDLASKGTSQIGGNLATNAGGLRVIRYGGTREQVLGLEVVLASGQVLDLNRSLRKDNSGIDLKHLFIGSEGLLGIITSATLRLVARADPGTLACLAVTALSELPRIVEACARDGVRPAALEFFDRRALTAVCAHLPAVPDPFAQPYPYYVLIELDSASFVRQATAEAFLGHLLTTGRTADVVVAGTSHEHHQLWALRENIPASLAARGRVRKNDLAVSIERLAPFLADLDALLAAYTGPLELVTFGHVGDGNVHINYVDPSGQPAEAFAIEQRALEVRVFEVLARHGGSLSAEHGIGLVKKEDLPRFRSPEELAMMRQLKEWFDPHGILNPGKVL